VSLWSWFSFGRGLYVESGPTRLPPKRASEQEPYRPFCGGGPPKMRRITASHAERMSGDALLTVCAAEGARLTRQGLGAGCKRLSGCVDRVEHLLCGCDREITDIDQCPDQLQAPEVGFAVTRLIRTRQLARWEQAFTNVVFDRRDSDCASPTQLWTARQRGMP
jgi:hypothetical protein